MTSEDKTTAVPGTEGGGLIGGEIGAMREKVRRMGIPDLPQEPQTVRVADLERALDYLTNNVGDYSQAAMAIRAIIQACRG